MSLSITDVWMDERLIVRLEGRLDTMTAKSFEDHLAAHLRQGQRAMTIDMRQVDYVSSYGLRVFLLTAKQLRTAREGFVLEGLTPDVRKIFQISGFDKILNIRDGSAPAAPSAAGTSRP